MHRPPAASNAAGAAAGPRAPELIFRLLGLKYHTVSVEKLSRYTINKITETGIPAAALGHVVGRRVTLTGCVTLPELALSTVPPALGGHAEVFATSPPTAELLARAVARSPRRGASLGSAGSAWRTPLLGVGPRGGHRTPSPPRSGGGGAAPTSAEKARVLRELADLTERAAQEEASLARAEAAEAAAVAARADLRLIGQCTSLAIRDGVYRRPATRKRPRSVSNC